MEDGGDDDDDGEINNKERINNIDGDDDADGDEDEEEGDEDGDCGEDREVVVQASPSSDPPVTDPQVSDHPAAENRPTTDYAWFDTNEKYPTDPYLFKDKPMTNELIRALKEHGHASQV